jgi:hypothetical protein
MGENAALGCHDGLPNQRALGGAAGFGACEASEWRCLLR